MQQVTAKREQNLIIPQVKLTPQIRHEIKSETFILQ